jgi:hypothetical protein
MQIKQKPRCFNEPKGKGEMYILKNVSKFNKDIVIHASNILMSTFY